LAIRQHFESDTYDIWTKKGRVRGTQSQFDARNDKSFYHALAYEYLRGDLGNFFMANILAGKTHVSQFEDFIFRDWKSKQHRLAYIFENDLKSLMSLGVEFRLLFDSVSGGIPIIIQAMEGNHISLETVCIINRLTNNSMMEKWDRKITDKFVWPNIRRKILKYQSWIRSDIEPLRDVLKGFLK
jgi:hypothetical protein